METPTKAPKSEESYLEEQQYTPGSNLLTSDGHHALPDIQKYHQSGCCTQTCWNLLSSLCFLGGAICYIVNGAGWTYLEVKYGGNAVTEYYYYETARFMNGTDELYYNYYYTKYEQIRGQFSWWEIAGASLYILNPVLDFCSGALCAFCICKINEELETKVKPKCLRCLPWDSLGATLFFVASCLYMCNIIIAMVLNEYEKIYDVVDFFACFIFVADAVVYLLGRIVRIQLAKNTPQAKALCCFGSAWTGFVSLDYGFYGDILFLIGAMVEVVDHFQYRNATNLVACILWALDALLYLVEWILINTTRDGLRYSERSSGRRYTNVSTMSRRQSLLRRLNGPTSVNGGTRPSNVVPNTPTYGAATVEDC